MLKKRWKDLFTIAKSFESETQCELDVEKTLI